VHGHSPQAAVNANGFDDVAQVTAGFQNAVIAARRPPLLDARTLSSCAPAASLTGSFHSRERIFAEIAAEPGRRPGLAASVETATSLMPLPPSRRYLQHVLPVLSLARR